MVRGHARRFAGFSERNERFMRLSDALRKQLARTGRAQLSDQRRLAACSVLAHSLVDGRRIQQQGTRVSFYRISIKEGTADR